jgi:hypothetical protein
LSPQKKQKLRWLTKLSHLNFCFSYSHYETDWGVSSAEGVGNTPIVFLKARQRWAFKKPIFMMRIAAFVFLCCSMGLKRYNSKSLLLKLN